MRHSKYDKEFEAFQAAKAEMKQRRDEVDKQAASKMAEITDKLPRGVTVLAQIDNRSSHMVWFQNMEHHDDDCTARPHGYQAPHAWIPWCVKAGDYAGHHHVLKIENVRTYFIWQEGDRVRYSDNDAFVPNGLAVPGYSLVNGDRTVHIYEDGTIEFSKS
jgi:hypothetical protein